MKIGITGGNGFIGKHIVQELEKKYKLSFFNLPKDNLLLNNPVALKKFVQDKDVIVHVAAINRGTDTEVIAGSVVATYNLISAMGKCNSRAKLIFLSSIQAETDTLYGKSKRLVEIMLEDFSKRTKNPVTILRLTNVFGEWGRPFYNSVVATFCYQIANGKELTINAESKNKELNLIYIGDIVKIISEKINKKRQNPFYFKKVESKNKISVGDLAELIKNFRNKPKLKNKFEKDLYKTFISYQYKSV